MDGRCDLICSVLSFNRDQLSSVAKGLHALTILIVEMAHA